MMEGMPVTLIVKAPNQQIEDQTIQCELSWTISKLKGYLSEVYPSKPTTEEQKLIYSGQLLNDNIILKDVLRRYDGENTNTHTMHLVCLPKRFKQTEAQRESKSPDGDGLRKRNVAGTETTAGSSQQPATSSTQATVTDTPTERLTANDAGNWNANWMHYMAQQNPQAFNYGFAPFADPSAPYQWNQGPVTTSQQQMNAGMQVNNQYAWMQYMYMQYMQQYNQMIASGTYPQMPYPYQYTQMEQQPQEGPGEGMAAAAAAGVAEAAAAAREAPEEGPAPAPDLLERLYVALRWVVLFLIIYFYSSPVRFVLVLSLAVIIYVYQAGLFRPIPVRIMMPHERERARREREERQRAQAANAENQNAEPERANANPERQDTDDQNQAAERQNANADRRPDAQQNQQQVPRENADAENNTLLTITWTIFTSFFTSLIPEAPNAL